MRTARVPRLVLWLCALLTPALGEGAAIALPADSEAWLNVVEGGASGSRFETRATTVAGAAQITVDDAGDFKVGQGVIVSRCNVRYLNPTRRGPGEPYIGASNKAGVEIRGYDGSAGSWIVYLLEIDTAAPTFRWSDDLGRTWKAAKVPVTYDWQPLSGGTEVRFEKFAWQPGHLISFTARDQLVSRIVKIEGKTLTLEHQANRNAKDALVRHSDSAAIQAVLDRAVAAKKNVYFPAGYYRLATGLRLVNAGGIIVEGQDGAQTVLDISDGVGACFTLSRGTEVTLRNFRLLGHTGLAEQPATVHTSSGFNFWACALKPCNAVAIDGTERVLVENVHASRMASECFFSGGPYRKGAEEPRQYTRSATFLRCSVTDCAANAFNNCDFAENTQILSCRIDGAGWHAYEGSGRFIRFIGNYVRNAGPVTVGDIPHTLPRLEHAHQLGVGQAVVADNVFEGGGRAGGIAVIHSPTQVVIANNRFINYNGNAISANGATVHNTFPSQNITITGNIIDMTHEGETLYPRTGIRVDASETIVSNNQIYVRGRCDPKVVGIVVTEGVVNVNVHDNLIRNCQFGLQVGRSYGEVTEVLDPTSFRQKGLPLEWRHGHLYRGWNVVWLLEGKPDTLSVIAAYDPDTLAFKLCEPRSVKVGGRFHAFPAGQANWNLHDNTIDGCQFPIFFNCFGSDTTILRANLVTRGEIDGPIHALRIGGRTQVIGNHVVGFDGPGSTALLLCPDPLGRTCPNAYVNNVFERCASSITESQPGLWAAGRARGNRGIECGKNGPLPGLQ